MNRYIVPKAIPTISPISHYASRKAWEDASWRKILEQFTTFRSKKEFETMLSVIVPPSERRNLIMRAAAIDRIRSGKSYREIGEELWLSSQTISAILKSLHETTYRSYRERGKTERKKRMYSSVPRKPTPKRRVRTKYGTVEISF